MMLSPTSGLCALAAFTALTFLGGCFGGSPAAVEAPVVDPADAVSRALETYDQDGDGALAGSELDRVPGIAMFLAEYDGNGDQRVSKDELTSRFEKLLSPVSFAKFNCTILFNNRPLPDAEVTFQPEPFMGEGFKAAFGTTNPQGGAKIAVPNDQLPEPNRRLGGGLFMGLYKVTVTHPRVKIPEAYQGENTVLGYEVSNLTSIGTQATLRLDSKGTKPR